MHIAFSLMVAVPAATLSRHLISRVLWCFYPPLVFFVIISTANHYWFDAAAGMVVAGAAALVALSLARLRPQAWSWSPQAAGQEA
jgi:hypothetical protein